MIFLDINNLLKGMDCPCGKTHTCDIKYVYIEKNAIARLADICDNFGNILLAADENTFAAAGDITLSALSGKTGGLLLCLCFSSVYSLLVFSAGFPR